MCSLYVSGMILTDSAAGKTDTTRIAAARDVNGDDIVAGSSDR